jgi:sugar phosphate isomerase/epimerase
MSVTRSQVAINALQWINLKPEPGRERAWLYADPAWRSEQLNVHRQIRSAGFDAVMIEVLDTQTLQAYTRMLDEAGLRPAPGYIQIAPPEATGMSLRRGSPEWVRWFDPVRRRAEETNYVGLNTVFLAAQLDLGAPRVAQATATGAFFDQDMLDRQVEYLAEAAEVLKAEGVRAGLHNHVGSLIETEYEIEYVMQEIDASLLGASFDIGHLEWAGIPSAPFLDRYRDRLVDLHLKDLDLEIAAASRNKATPYYEVSDQRFFLEPGLGHIDLPNVLSALGDDFRGWIIIEVDRPSMEPLESAKVSWRWVEENLRA